MLWLKHTLLEVILGTLQIRYDGDQHCTALRKSQRNGAVEKSRKEPLLDAGVVWLVC